MLIEPNSPQQLIELPIEAIDCMLAPLQQMLFGLGPVFASPRMLPVPTDRVRILALACGFFNADALVFDFLRKLLERDGPLSLIVKAAGIVDHRFDNEQLRFGEPLDAFNVVVDRQ